MISSTLYSFVSVYHAINRVTLPRQPSRILFADQAESQTHMRSPLSAVRVVMTVYTYPDAK